MSVWLHTSQFFLQLSESVSKISVTQTVALYTQFPFLFLFLEIDELMIVTPYKYLNWTQINWFIRTSLRTSSFQLFSAWMAIRNRHIKQTSLLVQSQRTIHVMIANRFMTAAMHFVSNNALRWLHDCRYNAALRTGIEKFVPTRSCPHSRNPIPASITTVIMIVNKFTLNIYDRLLLTFFNVPVSSLKGLLRISLMCPISSIFEGKKVICLSVLF